MPSFVTVDELVEWLRSDDIGSNPTDRKLAEECLSAAIEYTASKVGPLEPAGEDEGLTVTREVYPSGRFLVLPVTHLTGTITVEDPDGAAVTPRDVNALAGVIELPYAPRSSRPWRVRSTSREHGASVKLAVKIIAAHLWQLQRRQPGTAATAAYQVGDAAPKTGFAIPARAAQLLAPFTGVVIG